jgi:hypothetical protein
MSRPQSRRAEALELAESLLENVELGQIGPVDVARRASRLARLLDDQEAMAWLQYEVGGYPATGLDTNSAAAARRSRREAPENKLWTRSLASSEADAASAEMQLQQTSTGGSGGQWELAVERGKQAERTALRQTISSRRDLIDRIVGAIHLYVSERYQELRFGSAVESAFEVVRDEVDRELAGLVPGALPMVAAALENASSENPEHWAAAAATCRRLLKEVADVLRPPGEDVTTNGRTVKMGANNYINRLIDWIVQQPTSATAAAMTTAELEFLGRRLDAADAAGQKGAHERVERTEASRFITTTYLLLGDILRMRRESGS